MRVCGCLRSAPRLTRRRMTLSAPKEGRHPPKPEKSPASVAKPHQGDNGSQAARFEACGHPFPVSRFGGCRQAAPRLLPSRVLAQVNSASRHLQGHCLVSQDGDVLLDTPVGRMYLENRLHRCKLPPGIPRRKSANAAGACPEESPRPARLSPILMGKVSWSIAGPGTPPAHFRFLG
jgi:hypothetical protein